MATLEEKRETSLLAARQLPVASLAPGAGDSNFMVRLKISWGSIAYRTYKTPVIALYGAKNFGCTSRGVCMIPRIPAPMSEAEAEVRPLVRPE